MLHNQSVPFKSTIVDKKFKVSVETSGIPGQPPYTERPHPMGAHLEMGTTGGVLVRVSFSFFFLV